MLTLNSRVTELYRVGAKNSALLKKLGLESIHDLLFYFPFRYDDFSQREPIANLQAGQNTNIIGTIQLIQNRKSAKRRMFVTEALVSDDSDSIKVIWFNQPFLTHSYHVGDQISLAGRVTDNYGQLSLISPITEKVYSDNLIHTSGLVPNYHLTANINQKQLRSLIKEAIPLAQAETDWLPAVIKQRLKLLDLGQALQQIHFPQDWNEVKQAQERLGFTELFLRQLKAQMIKAELQERRAIPIEFQETATQTFVNALPFKLTNAQRKAAWEILNDLKKSRPMSRLLEGDVGSGKTLVTILALFNVVLNKKQGALMVPTEILAQQHFQTITKLLQPYNFKISLLTSSHPDKTAAEADIIIGTQSLIQNKVNFKNLALAIVDEQHRFGVKQRQKILDYHGQLEQTPHFLSLTATPIPRSLALAIYGDLDLSIIDELPVGRQPIITKIITEDKRAATYEFIRKSITQGRQAFIICPLIDESDKLGVKSVKQEHAKLAQDIFPELKVGLLHGKLKAKDKEQIMQDFLANKTQVLVSTAVIEVGVDVPNATIMIIEGAERFGLAQLHQFRGRVGRSTEQSYCFLFPSATELTNDKTIARLEALTQTNNGFALAKIDLQLRGAGELYGLGQSGFPELQIASLFDYANIQKAQEEAKNLITSDPDLDQHPLLKAKLGEWSSSIHLE
jgi:ATP-dependent DNA helicase RecG